MENLNLSESEIKDIVSAVVAELGQAGTAPEQPAQPKQFDFSRHPNAVQEGTGAGKGGKAERLVTTARTSAAANTNNASALPDLGDNAVGRIIGVSNPHNPEVVHDFVGSSTSRVASGRAGTRPRTIALLRFLADHSRSKDTVLKDVPQSWVENSDLLELHTEIIDKDQFLTRPDL